MQPSAPVGDLGTGGGHTLRALAHAENHLAELVLHELELCHQAAGVARPQRDVAIQITRADAGRHRCGLARFTAKLAVQRLHCGDAQHSGYQQAEQDRQGKTELGQLVALLCRRYSRKALTAASPS